MTLTRLALLAMLSLTAACAAGAGGPDPEHFKFQRDNTRAGR